MMGYYTRKSGVLNGRPIFQHKDHNLFLYYLEEAIGYWIIGEKIGEDIGGIQNDSCGDVIVPTEPFCKSGWMYGDRNETWQEDATIKLLCKSKLNTICYSADCSKPSVSVLCAEICYENYAKSLGVHLDSTMSEEKNGSMDEWIDFQKSFRFENKTNFWKYFEEWRKR